MNSMIANQIKEVLRYSQGINIGYDYVDKIVDMWEMQKQKLKNIFLNGQLIYEFPEEIQFELEEEAKQQRLADFIYTIEDTYGNNALADFIYYNLENFYSNTVDVDYTSLAIGSKIIQKGTKIIKAFKYFESNAEVLRKLQDQASCLIQENKVKGKLCLSIHPLDFLSSSENTYHWRSCHSLTGDYRAGNFSYMLDKVTLCAYLKGEDNVKLPGFPESVPWNSKRWRTLIFIDENYNIMFAGRQYPFSSKAGLDVILDKLNLLMNRDIVQNVKFEPWRNEYLTTWILDDKPIDLEKRYFLDYNKEVVGLEDVVKDSSKSMHYNDLLFSSCYSLPWYSIAETSFINHRPSPSLTIGEVTPCTHCGQNIVANSGSMLCAECELEHGVDEDDYFGYCALCNKRIELNNSESIGYGDYVCDECCEEHCFVCPVCGEYTLKVDGHYSQNEKDIICDFCYLLERKEEK